MSVSGSVEARADSSCDPTPYGWDWSATTHDARDEDGVRQLVRSSLEAIGGVHAVPGKGLQGWGRSVQAFDCDGYKLGQVYFGGSRTDVHVLTTSSAADSVRSDVLEHVPGKTSRVDTRVDSLVSFEDLRGVCLDVAGPQTRVTFYESQVGGESTGRTVYVGSPTSWVRVRLYEKWLESPGQYVEGTNRVEVQLRPPSRSKGDVSGWSRAETFCASKLTRRLASALGSDVAAPGTLQKSKGTPDLERTLEAMGHQYGKAVRSWLEQSSGDLGRVLDYLAVSES